VHEDVDFAYETQREYIHWREHKQPAEAATATEPVAGTATPSAYPNDGGAIEPSTQPVADDDSLE
jgi:hypothetical protein